MSFFWILLISVFFTILVVLTCILAHYEEKRSFQSKVDLIKACTLLTVRLLKSSKRISNDTTKQSS